MRYSSLVSLCGIACVIGETETNTLVSDSAGVEIVHNIDIDWQSSVDWQLSEDAVIDIGVVNGPEEYQLFRPSTALVLSDGRIVVANNGTNELRYYDRTGQYLRSSGGEGGGPGEFQAMSLVTRTPADTIIVFDRRGSRVSFFDELGEFVNSVTIETRQRFFAPDFLGWWTDGALVAGYTPRAATIEDALAQPLGIKRDTTLAVTFDRDGQPEDTLGQFVGPWTDVVMAPTDRGASVPFPTPFLFTPFTTFRSRHDTLYAGSGDSFEIRTFDNQGRLQRVIRADRDPTPVTSRDVSQLLEQLRESMERQGINPEVIDNRIERVKVRPSTDTFPLFSVRHWLVDADGNLWIARYDPRMEVNGERLTVTMAIFDATGQFLGLMKMPDRFRPTDIGDSYVVGIRHDALDVAHVQLYRLTRSPD